MSTAEKVEHVMSIMSEEGDTKVVWDEENDVEVEQARKTFNELKKKGYVAYQVNRKGDQGSVMTEFDPSAEKMILAPQMRGG